MIRELRNWLARTVSVVGRRMKTVQRDMSQQRSPPTSIYATGQADLKRYRPQDDILAARRLWAKDGYAAQLVGNVIDFAAGTGPEVLWESEKWAEALAAWEWNPSNPKDRFPALARTCVRATVRDGNIIQNMVVGATGPYLIQLNPGWLRQGSMGERGYAGVETDATGRPVKYIFSPRNAYGRMKSRPVTYRADTILHTFSTEWEDQLVGESWLRRSIDPLVMLDQTDALMVGSVQRAARTPLVFEIPLAYAYEYVRQLDSEGNPVDPEIPDDSEERAMQEQEAAVRVMRQTMLAGPLDHSIIPNEVKANFNPYRAAVSMDGRFLLLQRAAEGMGISMGTMLGDHGGGRLYSGKLDVAADEKFFSGVQEIVSGHLRSVLDWWIKMMRNRDPSLRAEKFTYEIKLPAFPIPDLRSDVIAMKVLHDAHLVSPQSWAMRYGYDAEKELEQWKRWENLLGGQPDDDGSGASGAS